MLTLVVEGLLLLLLLFAALAYRMLLLLLHVSPGRSRGLLSKLLMSFEMTCVLVVVVLLLP